MGIETMNTCFVLGAAPIEDCRALSMIKGEGDLVICADGGYAHAEVLGLAPDWLVGDFDSQDGDSAAPHVIRVRPEKDDTDLQLALEQGVALGYRKFVVIGALGGRLDHSLAAMQLLVWMAEQGYHCELLDGRNRMTVLLPGTHRIEKNRYYYLSLFAYREACRGITLKGMKYPLTNATVTDTYPIGVSNEILGDAGEVEFKDGVLLLIQTS